MCMSLPTLAGPGLWLCGLGGAGDVVGGAVVVLPAADVVPATVGLAGPAAEVVRAGDQAAAVVLLVAGDVQPAVHLVERAGDLVDDAGAAVVVTEPGVGGV